jgi:peptidoglycan/xylan/chitin deacetylase (PgdA/CDA1 family)
VLEVLLRSAVKHDIGAHGYYHREFTDLTSSEAEKELRMISAGLNKFGVVPKSFVFPKNSVAHLDLLRKHGYRCYRDRGGGIMKDRMYIERKDELYDIHPSLYLDDGTRLGFLKRMLDVAVAKKLPFHVWFHPWSFGERKEDVQRAISKLLIPFFGYARARQRRSRLGFETMLSAAEKVEMVSSDALRGYLV